MGADYTIWKPKTKERFLLWTGAWNEILNVQDCVLTKLTTSLDYIVTKLKYYRYHNPMARAQAILDFCANDEIVLTSDCGKEYFSEEDVFYGIKDTYKVIGDITK